MAYRKNQERDVEDRILGKPGVSAPRLSSHTGRAEELLHPVRQPIGIRALRGLAWDTWELKLLSAS